MNAIIVFLSILFISITGFTILRGLNFLQRKDTFLAIGASYGLGVGLIAFQLYFYFRLDIPWQKEFVLAPWIILIVAVLIRNRKHIKFKFPKITKLSRIDSILLIGILLAFSYTVFEALLRPVVTWDAWSNWLLYPKMFFIDGKITVETLRYTFSGQPLTVSLLGSFIYIILGRIDDTSVLLTSSAFYISIAIILFAVLRNKYGLRYALLFTFLFATTQNYIRHGGRLEAGLADLTVGYFAFLSVIFLFEYFKNHSYKSLLLFSIFLISTSLIKYEGIALAFFIAFSAFVYIIKHRLFKHLFILGLWVISLLIWQIDRKMIGIENTYFSTTHPREIGIMKSINAFTGTFKELINLKTWNFLWITYFYTLFAFGIKKQLELTVLNFVILSQLSLYLLMYNTTFGNTPESSLERLLMHVAPLAFYSIAIVFKLIFKNKKFTF
jgi:hypothetical protein